ncbi:MAG: hypothetical protein WDO73_13900 [Ignavibacteriota bacterium]
MGVTFLPQPARYHLEMEMGICLVAAAVLVQLWGIVPPSCRRVIWAFAAIAFVLVTLRDYQFARQLLRPAAAANTSRIRAARWIGSHLPGQRIMVSGEAEFWFNDFVDNPQLSGGHDPTAASWMQRVAVYTIYTGQNAGAQDGPISVLWLKAFGCGGITVPGRGKRRLLSPVPRIPRNSMGCSR